MFQIFCLLVLVSLGVTQDDKSKENETIKKLDLSNKGITSLTDYDFNKYPQLEELDLSNNLFEHIKEDKFIKNRHLKKLNLSGNTELKLPEYSTLLIADIEELNLSNCNIKEFPLSILDGLTQLKVIDLSGNDLTSFKLTTFTNLLSLEKIIFPNLNNQKVITEICNEINITIEDTETTLQCEDIRNGKWEGVKKEKIPNVDIPNDSLNPKELASNNTEKIDEPIGIPKTIEKKEIKNEINGTNILVVDTQPDAPVINQDATEKLNNTSTNEQQKNPEAANKTSENTHSLNSNATDSQIVINEKPADVVDSTGKEHDNKTAEAGSKPQNVGEASIFMHDGNTNSIKPSDNETEVVPKPKDTVKPLENQEHKEPDAPPAPVLNQSVPLPPLHPQPDVPAVVNQRTIPSPPQKDNRHAQVNENKIQKDTEQLKQDEGSEAPTGAATQPSTGTNILIFLVVAVIISGLAAFGYRFYKTRTYRTTNTQEPIERELEEIVTEKKSNGPTLSNVLEEEPLMQTNKNNVSIKEVDEQKNNHDNDLNHTTSNSKPYVPITSVTKEN